MLDLQNWIPPSAPTQMMYRSAIVLSKPADKANADDDGNYGDDEMSWTRSLKLAKTEEEEEEQGSAANMKSSSQCNINSISHNPFFSTEEGHQMLSFSGSQKAPFLSYDPNFAGYHSCGGAAAANMHGLFNGPFTHSQWMELEHQALIYKHITSNMPVPSSLLMPIRRALSHAAFSHSGHFTSTEWGGFHLGMQNNNDPEPGRCRRTDGKKWRCSREAVADQKYCERHINRGRHRSRKPVEGQSRYSVGKNASSALLNVAGNICGGSDGLTSEKRRISLDKKDLHRGTCGTSESAHNSRISMNEEMPCSGRVRVDPNDFLFPPSSLYNIPNNKQSSYDQLFGSDFGLVSSEALKNPSGQSIRSSTPTRQFIDECPKNHMPTMWPGVDDTQVSISSSSFHIKDDPSSLTLAWEFDSCDSIIGGPLGEVLQNGFGANNTERKNTSSSPTGVLQKEAEFTSRTNSSAGSSPRAETNVTATF